MPTIASASTLVSWWEVAAKPPTAVSTVRQANSERCAHGAGRRSLAHQPISAAAAIASSTMPAAMGSRGPSARRRRRSRTPPRAATSSTPPAARGARRRSDRLRQRATASTARVRSSRANQPAPNTVPSFSGANGIPAAIARGTTTSAWAARLRPSISRIAAVPAATCAPAAWATPVIASRLTISPPHSHSPCLGSCAQR